MEHFVRRAGRRSRLRTGKADVGSTNGDRRRAADAHEPAAWFYAATGYADIWDATLGTALALMAWSQVSGNRGLKPPSDVTKPACAGLEDAGVREGGLCAVRPGFQSRGWRASSRRAWIFNPGPGQIPPAILATLIYSLAAGIRQQNLLFFFPLWLMAIWPLSWPRRLGMAALMGAVSALWAIPLVNGAGGIAGYLLVVRQHTQSGLEGYSWTSWR